MTDIQTNVVFAFVGIMVWGFGKMAYRKFFAKSQEQSWNGERDEALDTIKKKNYDAHYYLPSIGSRDNEELGNALDSLAGQGFIITDKNGCLVGKVAKARLSSNEVAEEKRATFSVVD